MLKRISSSCAVPTLNADTKSLNLSQALSVTFCLCSAWRARVHRVCQTRSSLNLVLSQPTAFAFAVCRRCRYIEYVSQGGSQH